MTKELGEAEKPTEQDKLAAKALHEANLPGTWDSLSIRKQNALAKDEMYSRNYQALARAIMRK